MNNSIQHESASTHAPLSAQSQGLLSMVGTPIGNLSDISSRVANTLASSDVILCEDTRVTSRLLAHLEIHNTLMRCDENVIASRVSEVLERLEAGKHVSFVSDAGMPGVSDPGQRLVDAALDAGVRVEVIPGPSAVTCALVASGLPMEHFFFEGFLPRREKEQSRRLTELALIPGALVIYESPHRVAATLANIATVMPERKVALARELTKLHEEVVRGVAPDLAQRIAERSEVRGECVVVISAPAEEESRARMQALLAEQGQVAPTLEEAIAQGLAAGESKTALAKRLAKTFSVPRGEVYDRIVSSSAD